MLLFKIITSRDSKVKYELALDIFFLKHKLKIESDKSLRLLSLLICAKLKNT